MLGERQRRGDATFALLVGVVQVLQPELRTVAEQPQEITGVVSAGDDQDLLDPGVDERPQRVKDHRPVVDRQQMLVGDPRQRIESRAEAAGENDPLHQRVRPIEPSPMSVIWKRTSVSCGLTRSDTDTSAIQHWHCELRRNPPVFSRNSPASAL